MKCDECAKYLQEYVDGELNTASHASFETHIGQCNMCSTRLEASLSTRKALGCLGEIQQENEFTTSVMTKIKDAQLISSTSKEHQYTGRAPNWFNWRILAVGAVAAAAAFTIGLYSMLKPNQITQVPPATTGNPMYTIVTPVAMRPSALWLLVLLFFLVIAAGIIVIYSRRNRT